MRISTTTVTAAIPVAGLAIALSACGASSAPAAAHHSPKPAVAVAVAVAAAVPAATAVTPVAAARVKPVPTPTQAWNAAGGQKRDQRVVNDISAITNYSVAGLDNTPLRVAVWKLAADTQRAISNPPPHAAAYLRAMSELHAAATAATDTAAMNDMINGTSDLPAWVLTSTN